MDLPGIHADLQRLPGALPIWRGGVDATGWQVAASTMAKAGGRLVALWGCGDAACAVSGTSSRSKTRWEKYETTPRATTTHSMMTPARRQYTRHR